ncbi:hypothetical protein [Paraburkholderia sp. J8-2]|uniref:hypothetical protein n=1 Tax=Paraburkholderia sp. J8-2 TaxID=2805440 RepID=UPI002AB7664B|nr:hypothetical protein [Paraburkholderia sp. J8-2]
MNDNELNADATYVQVMRECRMIADAAHPGYHGLTDWISNVDGFLMRIGTDKPAMASGMVNDLHARGTEYSVAFGFSPERVRYFANRLLDGILLSSDEKVIAPMIVTQALAAAGNAIAYLRVRDGEDGHSDAERAMIASAIAALEGLTAESDKNACLGALHQTEVLVRDLFALSSTEVGRQGTGVLNDLRVAMTFLRSGIGMARQSFPIVVGSNEAASLARKLMRVSLPVVCLNAP